MRSVLLCSLICACVLLVGCEKSPEQKKREQAELEAKVAENLRADKIAEARARTEEEAATKQRAKLREDDIRRESREAFSKFDAEHPYEMRDIQDAATHEAAAARIRALMTDPASMAVRKSGFNADKTAVCMVIDYKEPGTNVTGRQALVTSAGVLIEPDKNNVAHRVFEIKAKDLGCDVALEATPKNK